LETLTAEDAEKLERNVRVREGGPVLPLSIEHYFELSDVEDEVVRSWYEYKVSCEALSLRELREAIRKDLFGTIIGRPVPQRQRRKMKPVQKSAKKTEPLSPEEETAYQKLLENITQTIREAEAKGVDIRHARHDILECSQCKAYEDVLCGDEKRTTYLHSGEMTSKEFQVVQCKEQSQDLEGGGVRCTLCYEFICGVCWVFQTQTIQKDYEE